MNDIENAITKLAQCAINGIGEISVPIQTEAGTLTVGVDPQVDFSKVDFNSFNINQINISDTHINIGFTGQLPSSTSIGFSIDSQVGSWTQKLDGDKTTISLDMSQTTIGNDVTASLKINDTILNLSSPSGTNDFSATFTLSAKF